MNFDIETLSGRRLTKNLEGSPVKATEFEKLEFVDAFSRTTLTIWDGGIFHTCGGKRVFAKICKTAKGKNSFEECCEDNIVPNGSFSQGETIVANLNNCMNLQFTEEKNDLYFKLKSENVSYTH